MAVFNEWEASQEALTFLRLGSEKTPIVTDPRYFIAVFGAPQPPQKDLVESGLYHPATKFAPFPVARGDVMLLYCTSGYTEHYMEAPGIGIALDIDDECIKYRWLPFAQPISKAAIDSLLESEDRAKFGNIRFDAFWLFEISPSSFSRIAVGRMIAWEGLALQRTT
jgi:hypothetical protein